MNLNMPSASGVSAVPDVPNQKVSITRDGAREHDLPQGAGHQERRRQRQRRGRREQRSGARSRSMRSSCWTTPVPCGAAAPSLRSRRRPDNQSSPVCPIGLTRNAAKNFVDVLAQGGVLPASTNIAFTSFRACYADTNINPLDEPNTASAPWSSLRGCVKYGDTIGLSNDASAIKPKIDTMRGAGGFPGTNLCLGLARGYKTLTGAGAQAGARKVLVILPTARTATATTPTRMSPSQHATRGQPPHRQPGAEYLPDDEQRATDERRAAVRRHRGLRATRPAPATTRTRPRTAATTTSAPTTWTSTHSRRRTRCTPPVSRSSSLGSASTAPPTPARRVMPP